jgi:hypothetical protein
MRTNKNSMAINLILFFSVYLSTLCAQDYIANAAYSIALPIDKMKNYTSKTSFRGVSVEWRKFIEPNFSAGILFAWQVFYERTTDRISLESGDITGTQDRTINSIPILATGHYYWGEDGKFRFITGLGLGIYRVLQQFEIGIYGMQENNWRFGIMPDIGIIIPLTNESGFSVR